MPPDQGSAQDPLEVLRGWLEQHKPDYEGPSLLGMGNSIARGGIDLLLGRKEGAFDLGSEGRKAGLVTSPEMMDALGAMTFATPNVVPKGALASIVGFHGTPYKFEPVEHNPFGAFRDDAIGSGEGAQAYGHGHYVAGNPKVAADYQNKLTEARPFKEIRDQFLEQLPEDAEHEDVTVLLGTGHFSPEQETFLKALKADDWLGFDYPSQAISAALGGKVHNWDPSKALLDSIEPLRNRDSSSLYQVEITPEEHELLDWDSALSAQHPEIVKKLGGPSGYSGHITGADLYHYMEQDHGSYERASRALSEAGIPGIKYLDQGSRDKYPIAVWNGSTALPQNKQATLSRVAKDGSVKATAEYYDNLVDEFEKNSVGEVPRGALEERKKFRGLAQWLRDNESSIEVKQPKQTYNYVIFDPKHLKITHRNGVPLERVDHTPTFPEGED